MKRLLGVLVALILGAGVGIAASPDSPVQAGPDYLCAHFHVTNTTPDYATGTCTNYSTLVYSFRMRVTCTSGNPVNQVTRYGPSWVRSGVASQAHCPLSYPILLGAGMQARRAQAS